MASGYRDSRFGQFADPNFGASLYQRNPSQGVLPTSGSNPSTSGSSASSNGLTYPRRISQFSEAPGPGFDSGIGHAPSNPWPNFNSGIGHAASGPGVMGPGSYLAEGGPVEDSDTGNMDTGSSDPFSLIRQAMDYGRKAYNVMGLFGDTLRQGFKDVDKKAKRDLNNMFDPAQNDVGGQMAEEQTMADPERSGDVAEFQNNMILQNTPEDESLKYGDMDVPGQKKNSMWLADGGVIPDGTESADTEGEDAAPAQGGANPQQAMAYLSGHGGVSPEVAQAMENAVDPQGQMDPSDRKLAAIQRTGSPEKAFALMQHYRAKFNAYSAFARAALQGAGGRPPNPQAAAEALNQAYANVPDGQSMRFTPTQGGMRVQVRGGKKPAPQKFEDGGEVEEYPDDFNYETGVGQDESPIEANRRRLGLQQYGPEGRTDTPQAQAQPQDDENFTYETGVGQEDRGPFGLPRAKLAGTDPSTAIKDFVVSIGELLGWTKGPGQFDKQVDNPSAPVASDETQGGMVNPWTDINARAPAGGPPQPTRNEPTSSFGRMMQDPYYQGRERPAHLDGSIARDWKTHPPEEVAKEALKAGSIEEADHILDMAYPMASQQQQKQLARLAFRQNYNKNEAGLEKERIKGGFKLQAADIGARTKAILQQANAADRMQLAQMAHDAAMERIVQSGLNKERIQEMKLNGQFDVLMAQEAEKAWRAMVGVSGSEKTATQGMEAHRPNMPQRPQVQRPGQSAAPAQPQGGDATAGGAQGVSRASLPASAPMKLYQGRWYTRGPNGESIPVID